MPTRVRGLESLRRPTGCERPASRSGFSQRTGWRDLWGGPVHYEDLTKVRLRLPGDQTYFCKHLPFYWEREFRLLISLMQPNEFGVDTPGDELLVTVDLVTLIQSILLG